MPNSTVLRRLVVLALTLGAGAVAPAVPAAHADPASGAGDYVALAPSRLLDTRATHQTVAPGGTLDLGVSGAGGLPDASQISAVVLNLTATRESAAGYVTAYPAGTTRPVASVVNFAVGETRAHAVVVAPGAGGDVSLYNGSAGSTDLVVDVSGYYTAGTAGSGGQFMPVTPTRLLDTRTTLGGHHASLTTGRDVDIAAAGVGGLPAAGGISAIVLNVTATRPTGPGYLFVDSRGSSAVNYQAGRTVSNLVVAPLAADGTVRLTAQTGPASSGRVDAVVDVYGYYRAGSPSAAGRLGPIRPYRVLDTRTDTQHAIPAHGSITVQISRRAGIPADATAAALNLTVAAPTGAGYLVMYPAGGTLPPSSTINFDARIAANTTIATLGDGGAVTIVNVSSSPQDVVLDATAYVGAIPGPYVWGPTHDFGYEQSGDVRALSCASATFCVAVGDRSRTGPEGSAAWLWNGTSWSGPTTVSSTHFVNDVSCVSGTFCVAVADDRSFRFDGSSWASVALLPDPGAIPLDTRTVSCTSTTFCMASGGRWDVPFTWRFDGTAWTESDPGIQHQDGRPVVSCTSSTYCVAVGSLESWDASVWNGSAWHAASPFATDDDVQSISCATGTCTAVSGTSAYQFTGTSWGAPQPVVTGFQAVRGVACVSSSQCIATVTSNSVSFGDGTGWTSPAGLDPSAVLGSAIDDVQRVSCPTASFCMVISADGATAGRA